MQKISIIVPVYNAEKYLSNTISSIINQTFKDIEIILVNDGSTDNSLSICEEFAKKDDRIVIINKNNEGVSSARNTGISKAKGEYIGFCDADDLMEKDMYEVLYHAAIQNKADCTICGLDIVFPSGRTSKRFGTNKIICWNRKEDTLQEFLLGRTFARGCYNQLIRKEICKETQFAVDKSINEDRYFVFEVLMKSNTVCFVDFCKYHYIIHNNSLTTGRFKPNRFDKIYFSEKIKSYIEENYPNLIDYANYNLFVSKLEVTKELCKDQESLEKYNLEYNKSLRDLKEMRYLVKNEFFPPVRIIEIMCLLNTPDLYIFIINFINNFKKILYDLRGIT